MVVVAIKESTASAVVKKGEVSRAIIVRQRKELRRADGSYVRFGDNAVILVSTNDKGETAPVGKRVFGPVARELREKFRVITNMAEEVI
jgi:large subunit ribosomal protein L14